MEVVSPDIQQCTGHTSNCTLALLWWKNTIQKRQRYGNI
jgi:hypothetical protein